MYTEIMIHNFCNLKLRDSKEAKKFISPRKNLNVLKLALDFIFQHAMENQEELLPAVIASINNWFERWEGKERFLNLANTNNLKKEQKSL